MNKLGFIISTLLISGLAALAIALIIIPASEKHETKEIGVLNTSSLEYMGHNIYMEKGVNDSSVTLYVVTTQENETESYIQTSCCDFLGDNGHWKQRDMPVKIYQSDTLSSLTSYIGNNWHQQTGIDLMGVNLQSNMALTNERRLDSWSKNINVVGYQSLPNNPNALAVAILRFEDASFQHIINYGIAINADVNDICDATHDSGCHDLQCILNHEFGHVYGLADLYATECEHKLMFNSLEAGDIRKRTIGHTAKSCVNELYEGVPIQGEETISNSSQELSNFWWFIMLGLYLQIISQ